MPPAKKPYPREACEFITDEGLMSFPSLEPGEAKAITSTNADPSKQGGYSYKVELILDTIRPESSLFKAVQTVAWYEDNHSFDAAGNSRHLFGRDGAFRKLEEMPKRDKSLYPYAINKHVLAISSVWYPKMLKMEGINLSDPSLRAKYDQAVAGKAPGVHKFCNPANPADVARVVAESDRLRMLGGAGIPEADYYKTTIRVQPHEYWPGCYVKVAGRAYWSEMHKTVLLALTHVLFTREGERLVAGEKSPDQVFGGFAPDASMAPPPMHTPPPAPPQFLAPPPPPSTPPGWAV